MDTKARFAFSKGDSAMVTEVKRLQGLRFVSQHFARALDQPTRAL